MTHTVGAVARLAGITIRTLHHYDEIGLLRPSARSDAGYRHYDAGDLERLQQILLLRELGLGLDEIVRVLDDPEYDRLTALRQQRSRLVLASTRTRRLIAAVDAAIAAAEEGRTMTPEESLEVFGDFDPAQYQAEAEERWGHTDAYRESARRTRGYTKADWQEIGVEADAINQAFIALMDAGVPAGDPAAAEVVDRHRDHISKWFYPCSEEIHRGLGVMYVADHRFTENIDRARPGLAAYMSAAISARWE